jgi:hypothetical protein
VLCTVKLVFGRFTLLGLGGMVFSLIFAKFFLDFFSEVRKLEIEENTLYHPNVVSSSYPDRLIEGVRICRRMMQKSPLYTLGFSIIFNFLIFDVLAAALPLEKFITPVIISESPAPQESDVADESAYVESSTIQATQTNVRATIPKKPKAPDLCNITLLEPERDLTISEDAKKVLFFQTTDWTIPKNATCAEAAEVIVTYVNSRIAEKRADQLALKAPQAVKDEVALASNTEIWDSADLDSVLAVQEKACSEGYENFDLANLISNSYDGYGLAYFYHSQMSNTTEYYLLTSILWRFYSLSFNGLTRDKRRQILRNISQTYEDISLIDNLNRNDKDRAAMLSEAFQFVRNNYFE